MPGNPALCQARKLDLALSPNRGSQVSVTRARHRRQTAGRICVAAKLHIFHTLAGALDSRKGAYPSPAAFTLNGTVCTTTYSS
jgi:hypothetical protein